MESGNNPACTTVGPQELFTAFLSGAARLEQSRAELNAANGFPVPDMDTGSNLSFMMRTIIERADLKATLAETLRGITNAALDGARGNSGAIFSHYFAGFSRSAAPNDQLALSNLEVCFAEAYQSALKAVYQPKEGTILTAMRAWAQVFGTLHRTAESIGDLFERALKELDAVVQATRNTLPEQRRLGLADAGAIGFYRFIEGFAAAFLGRPVRAEAGVRLADFVEEHPLPDTAADWALTHRYCTEVLFAYDSEEHLFALREELAQVGDSLMMTWAEAKARVHLHTDFPAQAVALVVKSFIMSEHKVEDMHMQMRLSKRYPGKTALIIDSIADIPRELLEQEHVYELPMNLMADGVAYYDKRTADAAMLARYQGRVTSSQQNATQIRAFLSPILAAYDDVVVLTVSSKMSGVFDRYRQVMEEDGISPEKLHLVDSLTNSGAEGLLARKAMRRLREGWSGSQLKTELESLRSRANILVSLPDLKAMADSGRINRRVGQFLVKTGFLPLVTIDRKGKGTVTGLAFSQKGNQRVLFARLRRAKAESYAVVHAGAPDEAEKLANKLTAMLGKPPVYIAEISSVVTIFSGPGSLAVAWLDSE